MNWLARFTDKGSSATAHISGKEVNVFCSARADRALLKRDTALIVELELAFACIARKQVRFHETPTSTDLIQVNAKLALFISTIIPATCEITTQSGSATTVLRNFTPKWVRIDYDKGKWVGEYGL